jgi:hypothetical protein
MTRTSTKVLSCLLLSLIHLCTFAQTNVSGDVSGTWTTANSPYILIGTITVPDNQTLVIQPGVEIRSADYQHRFDIRGTLKAKGTAADSIRFIGVDNSANTPGSSHAGQIYFHPNGNNSELQYVAINRWGDVNTYGSALNIYSSSVSITNSSIRNTEGIAINLIAPSLSPVISAVSFSTNAKDIETPASSVGGVSSLTNVVIHLRSDATSTSCTIPKPGPGSYYVFTSNGFEVSANTTTTISPGVEIRSTNYSDRLGIRGTLIAKGTAADSIRLVGFENTAVSSNSSHGGQVFFYQSSTNSELDYVAINRWGDINTYGSALFISAPASVRIEHSSVRFSEGTGIVTSSSSVTVASSTIQNSGTIGISLATTSIDPIITLVSFSNNTRDIEAPASSVGGISNCSNVAIYLRSDATSTSCLIPKPGPGSYYVLTSNGFQVSGNTTTTIQPGVEIRSLDYSDRIYISGTLKAKGTVADSIRFVGFANTTINPNSTHGGQLYFYSSSQNSELDYVAIDRWGDVNTYGSVFSINTASLTITHSSIRNSESIALNITTPTLNPVISNVRFVNNPKAIEAPASSVGGISSLTNVAIYLRSDATSASCLIPKPGPGSYYVLTSNGFQVSGNTTTTIQPGVEIRSMNYSDRIYISGTLKAIGTVSDSIRFVGFSDAASSPNSTHGGNLYFNNGSSDSELDYVAIDHWGDVNTYGNAIFIAPSVSVSIKHASIRNSEGTAIVTNSASVTIATATIRNSGNLGISIAAIAVSPVLSGLTFINNQKDIEASVSSVAGISSLTNVAIYLRNDATSVSCTIPKPGAGSYYVLDGGFQVSANTTTTIAPGVEIRSMSYVDRIYVSGTLKAIGTVSDSIRFVGFDNQTLNQNSTHGGQLYFYTTSTNSELDYVAMSRWGDTYGNSSPGAISVNTSSFTMAHSSIRNSEDIGINISPVAISPLITSMSFMATPRAIEAPASSVGGLSSLTNVAVHLRSDATSTSCTIPKPGPGSYYVLASGGFQVSANTTTTIQPGVEIRSMSYADRIYISGTLTAKGTPADSIRLIGFENTASNANSTHGGQLYFYNTSTNSELEYVVIDRWGDTYGSSYPGAINVNTSSFTIAHSSIRNSEDIGINISPVAISPLVTSMSFIGTPRAIEAPASSVGGLSSLTNVAVHLRADATSVSCTIPKPGPNSYYVLANGGFQVSANTTTTIAPGVEIRSMSYVDQLLVNGTLKAKGTASDSIRFIGFENTAINQSSTHGGRLYFYNNSTDSELEYVVMNRWGDNSAFGLNSGAIQIQSGAVRITRSTIRHSEGIGIAIESASINPIISSTTFRNNPRPIDTPASSVGGISSLTNVAIYLQNGTNPTSCTISQPGPGSYYVLNGGFTVPQSTTTTIAPGVEIRSMSYADQIFVSGTLKAKGTAIDSIRFVGLANPDLNPNSTHGGRINLYNNSTDSELEYITMNRWGDTYAYGNTGAIQINSTSVSISKSSIRNSEESGIKITGNAITPTITANQFSANSPDIDTYPGSIGGILNNTNAKILINGGTITANTTWPLPGTNSYYILNGTTQVNQGYTLTIEAGTLVDFGLQSGELYIGGALRAIGTEMAPIQLIRLQNPTSSAYGGRVYLHSTSTNSILNYVILDKLGSTPNNYAALHIATSNFSLANSTISNSQATGLQCDNVGNAIISSSNFYGNKTGVYVTSGRPTFNHCNIYGNVDFGINNTSFASTDTVDARNSYWGTPSGPYHPSLNLGGLGNKVSDKVKFTPWSQQPLNGQLVDIGISAILAPTTDCNHTASDSVTVRIINYGNVSQSNFQVSYRINTSPTVSETITTASLLPGKSVTYTFAQKVNLSATGSYTISAFTSLAADTIRTNDTIRTTIQHLPGLGIPGNLTPLNNAVDLNIPVILSWGAVTTATGYDVFVWKVGDPVPSQPLVANLTQISYTVASNILQFGSQYNWKVVAKRASCRAETSVLTFTTRQLPDLIVESIDRPTTAVSETDIVVSWKVKNQGLGSTQNQGWTDIAYLCDQPTLNAGVDNFYIGSLPNFSALNAGQAYQSNTLTFRLPQGIQGNYYVIVQTNPFHAIQEVSSTNNQLVSSPINVSLAPPPDLQVTNVVANPLNAFSEDSVTVTYTVKNMGSGPTTTANWTDHISIGQDELVNSNTEPVLYSYTRQQVLLVNGEYTVTTKVKLPARIGGTYYIHVVTDRFNQVYEYNLETNNSRATLPLTIIQKPTPNLIVNAISITADTVASNQPVTVQWTTSNEGSIVANPTWQEYIYLSTDNVFSLNTDRFVGAYSRILPLNSLSSSSIQQVVNLPANLGEGTYYFFVKTDAGNNIYENPDEDDNVSVASTPIHVVNPDLKPISFTAPANAASEQTITVQWKVKNDSRAGIYNASWTDRIYLSANNTFEPGTDILLTSVTSNQLLAAGNEYSKQTTLSIPLGISGSYHLLLITDADQTVFEKVETNNLLATPITITLSPWPDLQVTSVVSPATDTVGTAMNIRYTISNTGTGNIDAKYWTDNIYLSPTNTINEATLIYVTSIARTRSLASTQSFTQAASFTLPTTLPPGPYYVVVKADISNTIFEHTGENNNTAIATTATTITALPAIDLSVIAGDIISTTVTAGKPVNLQWTVKNNSATATVIPSWKDAVYLSANPILDANDILLSTVTINTPVTAGGTYTKTHTVTIPVDVSGNLYLLVTTDKDNQQNDDVRGNNTLALNNSNGSGQAITITVPPPSDLVPISLFGPAQGTVSQPISVSFTVRNNGTGPTSSGSWTDQLYLSTDLQLGNDILLATFAHTGTLSPTESYTVADQVFLPADVSGNYVLLLKTDAGNTVYEQSNEENNLAFANIFINPQQPSDLIVTDITVPTSEQYAGNTSTISWKLTNIGVNPTNGFLREAVYLSKDTLIDTKDVLFGTLDQVAFLPSQATETRTLTKALINVTVGEYYVLVKTDILNNIVEQNEANNQAISVSRMKVNVKELPMNVLTATTLPRDQPIYYRLTIPSQIRNETLSIVLKGDSVKNAVNRLFIRKDSIPTVNQYDYAAAIPYQANQEVIIPSLQAGTYYLMSVRTDLANLDQQITLLPKIIPFSISTVDANTGGNTGLATIKITGAKFEPGMTVKLVGSTTLTATNVYFSDPSKIFATFNLSGVSLGQYTVQLDKSGGEITQLPNSFTVIPGTPGGVDGALQLFTCTIKNLGFDENIGVNIVAPATARRGSVFKMTVAYSNQGNVDIPAQNRVLVSLSGVPVSFSTDFHANSTELVLELVEKDGPPDILRAGSSGFINIYSKASLPVPQMLYTITY